MPLKNLIKLTALLAASNALTKVAAMGFVLLLAKTTTVSEFGTFKYLVTLSFLCALALTGVTTPLTRNVGAQARNPTAAAGYLSSALAITLPVFVVVALIISFVSTNPLLLTLLLYAATVDALYAAYVRGLLDRRKMAGYKLLANVIQLTLLAVCYLVFHSISLVWAVLLYSLSGTLSLIVLECGERTIYLRCAGTLSRARELIHFSLLATVANVGATVLLTVNTLWINRFCGKEQLAYYGVAEALAAAFMLLPDSISAIAMPKAAALKNHAAAGRPLLWLTAGCAVASLALIAPFLLFGPFVVSTLFTDAYLPATQLILPLAVGSTAIGVHLIYSALYYGFNRPRIPTVTITIGCALNVCGSWILTKRFGAVGAAWSYAASGVVILALMMVTFHAQHRGGATRDALGV